ncbi:MULTISPECIES: hypothetical protein [Haloferax]|uniref:NrS-1 polymerase-like HBD domain-containing protein n=2 Tax=Haloferax TaxID=2251 RepID=A0A6G1YY65_9EURY|nr:MULTISPECIES: hypothetical protein [Haloferax]KAB1186622.1 hypothetical protein Hfx1149_00680 [Haloferax sp. CBA1149]MRW79240.1 hypothetical protein [Haloferax marinisediminis]
MTPPLPTRDALPDDLCERAQWVGWRKQTRTGAETKVPQDVTGGYASATDAKTWTTFDEALAYAEAGNADGVGFVFTDDDPYVGIDLDKCRDSETGETEEWSQMIIDRMDSYTEVSPSGTGYHIIINGDLPPDGNRTGNLELYDQARFFTVTGERVDGPSNDIEDRTAELTALHAAYFETPDTASNSGPSKTTVGVVEPETGGQDATLTGNGLTDEDIVKRASNAANGLKFSRLWKGDAGAYDSHSEADMALSSILAFWTGGDAQQMDRLVRDSRLYREKWDEVHYADGSTYGEKTIERAIAGTTEYYDPSGFSSAVRRSTTRKGGSRKRTRERDDDAAIDGTKKEASAADVGRAARARETAHLERLNDLQTHLESVLEENERLQAELEAERERRRELEAQVAAADDTDDDGWWLVRWFRRD